MIVQVTSSTGELLWAYGEGGGYACTAYVRDGTQQEIIRALQQALEQAEAELADWIDVDRVLDVGAGTG